MREDWAETTIGNVADYLNGRGFKKSEWETEGLPIIRIQNLNKHDAPFNYTQNSYEEKYSVKNGDLLFSWSASLGVYIWNRGDAWLNQHIFKVVPKDFILKDYLLHSLQSIIQLLYAKTHGSGMVHITKKNFEATKFHLPPLPEQRAIVAKIEELFSDLDKGIADLKKAQDQLKVYRQAVLKKAFEGELTKEWREQQTDLPSADDLLEQIKEERQKHYEQQIENWKQAEKAWEENGKEGKKPRKPNPKTFLAKDENNFSNLFSLPSSWQWIPMGNNVSEIVVGYVGPVKKHLTDDHVKGIRFLSTTHIGSNGFKNHDIRYVTSEFDIDNSKSSVQSGDILIARHGDSGKSCLVPEYIQKAQVSNAVIVRGNRAFQDLTFVVHCFNFLKHFLKDEKVGGVQQVVNTKSMEAFPYPLLTIKEQHQIVQEIESRLSVCDKVEESITESLEKAKALRQSILKKAFEGTLLSEEEISACKAAPDYEPASVLLEKIKAEKKK